MTLGYDQAVALPARQSDGQGGQDELFKETNKARHGRSPRMADEKPFRV